MIPFSTNARHNSDFPVVKNTNPSRIFGNLRILSLFSLIVLFAIMPPPATMGGQINRDQSQGSGQIGEHRSVGFPAGHPIKKRKASIFRDSAEHSSRQVTDENPSLIHSVSVPKAFSYAVVQQPEDNDYYVSNSKKLVTEFALARKYNNIGLLAHNNLAGYEFKDITLGQEIHILYTDGRKDRYTVSAIYRFQALKSTDTESHFVDLESGKTLSATEVFTRMYTGAPHITLQTCIAAKGDASWGRLFVIATPVVETQ